MSASPNTVVSDCCDVFQCLQALVPEEQLGDIHLKDLQAVPWHTILQRQIDEATIQLLEALLAWSPHIRPNALESLTYTYYDQIRAEHKASDDLFNFTHEEVSDCPYLLPKLNPVHSRLSRQDQKRAGFLKRLFN